jgi:hypothetical protein
MKYASSFRVINHSDLSLGLDTGACVAGFSTCTIDLIEGGLPSTTMTAKEKKHAMRRDWFDR